MPDSRDTLSSLLAEIRRRRSALTRAWNPQTLDRVATELSQRFFFDEALVRSLIRDEIGERPEVSIANQGRTRSDLEALKNGVDEVDP